MGVGAAPPLVAPFVAERYADGRRLSKLIAPPYDVLSPADRERYARRHDHNIVHLILPEGDVDRYAAARKRYERWRRDGVLVPDKTPAVYVLRQKFTTRDGARHARTGVIAGVAVEPPTARRVLPHERTHAGPKEDRLALLAATGAMFETLFMLARDEDGDLAASLAEAAAKRPTVTAELRGVELTLWRVPGARGRALAEAAGRGALYMADGHHRYETAVAYRAQRPAADRIPALIVAVEDPGLVVLATHRIVRGASLDRRRLVSALRERFQMRDVPPASNYMDVLGELAGRGTGCLLVLPDGPAIALLLRGDPGEPEFANEPAVALLDVARVDELVVNRLVSAAGDEARLEYTPDPHEAIDLVHRGDAVASVLLNPTPAAAVLRVADARAVMPQKSTYFYPKVPSGLVVLRYS